MVPESTESNPAINRSKVVLPPPDAPKIVRSEPSVTVNETSRSTETLPKDLETFSSRTFSDTYLTALSLVATDSSVTRLLRF